MNSADHLLITGANGYVGRYLVALAQRLGVPTTVLGRRAPSGAAVRFVPWHLGETVPTSAFEPEGRFGPVTCVVHLAHDWTADERPAGPLVNVEGAQRLLAAARAAGVRRVLVASSQSAVPSAKNAYGRAKYRIETLLRPPQEIAVRIGLVYGGIWGGPAGTLLRLAKTLPAIPIVAPAAPLRPIHVEDAARGLLELATGSRTPQGPVVLAGLPASFLEFVQAMSTAIEGGRPIPCPIPAWAIEALGGVRLIPPRYLERLLGLMALQPFEGEWDAQLLGFMPRTLADGLAPLRRQTDRRQLISEANTLLRYLLGETASPLLMRRYVAAASRWDGGVPVRLPLLARLVPAAMRLFEPVQRNGALGRRIDMAVALSDATPQGYRRFYGDAGGYWPLVRLFAVLMLEGALLPVRLLLRRR